MTIDRLTAALADRYRIERELGQGGMATVYLAHDLKHDRHVALKVIKPDIAGILGKDRFAREIRLAARLQHPHICSVYDSGESPDGQLWYTMPFVAGESLRDRLQRDGRLPIGDAVRIIREAALGLAAAHAEGVIHRDLKPENILLAKDGTTLVADFGIAKAPTATGHEATQLTETGVAIGTPAYMSPEQRLGGQVDARSDVYSLALTLYELLVGDLPPGSGGGLDLFLAQMTDAAPRMRIKRPEISEALEAAVRRGLAADPAQRYASMAEFQRALDPQRSATTGSDRASRWRGRGRLVAATLVVAAAGALLFLWRQGASRSTSLPTSAAVLPFADQSPGHDQAYFSDGLAEELTTVLARIPGLRVAARSSAFQFRGATLNVRDVGRQLGVGAILEGSVQRSGNRLRVSAQLVDSRSGYELWSEIYDRDFADVFQVQEEIARAIGTALKLRLAGGADTALRHRPTRDLEAYDLYLKGRFAWNQRTGVSLPEAARFFEQVVARDSGLSRAWAGLADTYVLLPLYTGMAPGKAWPHAKAAALRAIALDGQSAEAHTSLAYGTMLYEWDWAASERSFHLAIAADSTYPTAHHWYADFLAGRGRLDEALVEMTRAQALDPLSRIIASEVGWLYIGLHRLDEADSTLTRLLRLDPNYAQSLLIMGQLRVEQRRYPEAIAALVHSLALDGESAHGNGMLVVAYARAGQRAKAQALLDSLTARSAYQYVPPFVFALGYANLGDLDRAFAEIERGIRERDVLLPENFFEPLLDPLKRDRRYAGVVARLR